MVHTQNESSNETWSLYFSIQRGERSKFKAKVNELKMKFLKFWKVRAVNLFNRKHLGLDGGIIFEDDIEEFVNATNQFISVANLEILARSFTMESYFT